MNARNKNGQLTFESTFGSTEKAESEVPSSNDDISGLRAVRVLPDVPAIDKAFDYSVPQSWIEDGERKNSGSSMSCSGNCNFEIDRKVTGHLRNVEVPGPK